MTKITKYSLPFPEMHGKTKICLPYTPDRQNPISSEKSSFSFFKKTLSGLNVIFSHFTLKDKGKSQILTANNTAQLQLTIRYAALETKCFIKYLQLTPQNSLSCILGIFLLYAYKSRIAL